MQSLTYQDVLTILRLIDAGPFARFEVEFEGTKIAVTRGGSPSGAPVRPSRPAKAVETEAKQASVKNEEPATDTVGSFSASHKSQDFKDVKGAIAVRSPMAGTFYAAPSPGAPPFVEVGSTVRKDDQVGTVEVMKLFTSIRAPIDGTVRAIMVANEEVVEKDGAILWIEPVESATGERQGSAR